MSYQPILSEVSLDAGYVYPDLIEGLGLAMTEFTASSIGIYIVESGPFDTFYRMTNGCLGIIDFKVGVDKGRIDQGPGCAGVFFPDYSVGEELANKFSIPLTQRRKLAASTIYLDEPYAIYDLLFRSDMPHPLHRVNTELNRVTQGFQLIVKFENVHIFVLDHNGYTENVYGKMVMRDEWLGDYI